MSKKSRRRELDGYQVRNKKRKALVRLGKLLQVQVRRSLAEVVKDAVRQIPSMVADTGFDEFADFIDEVTIEMLRSDECGIGFAVYEHSGAKPGDILIEINALAEEPSYQFLVSLSQALDGLEEMTDVGELAWLEALAAQFDAAAQRIRRRVDELEEMEQP